MTITKGSLVEFSNKIYRKRFGFGLCISHPIEQIPNLVGLSWEDIMDIPLKERIQKHFYSPGYGRCLYGPRKTVQVYWQELQTTTTEIVIFLSRVTKKGQLAQKQSEEKLSKVVDPCHVCGAIRTRGLQQSRFGVGWCCECPGRLTKYNS